MKIVYFVFGCILFAITVFVITVFVIMMEQNTSNKQQKYMHEKISQDLDRLSVDEKAVADLSNPNNGAKTVKKNKPNSHEKIEFYECQYNSTDEKALTGCQLSNLATCSVSNLATCSVSNSGLVGEPPLFPKVSVGVTSLGTASVLPTPVGVVVAMSDGTTKTYPLGTWLEFSNGVFRVIFPTQYVNQFATYQSTGANAGSWTYPQAGRNVQVWRNGVLQKPGVDYNLNQSAALLTPIPFTLSDGTIAIWNATDYVTVAYIY